MSIELLRGEEGYLRFGGVDIDIYHNLLDLAHKHGWKPMGTSTPWDYNWDKGVWELYSEWDGNYWTNDFQTVVKEDADELANGLERAGPQSDDHTEFFRKELIAFCRGGAFGIG